MAGRYIANYSVVFLFVCLFVSNEQRRAVWRPHAQTKSHSQSVNWTCLKQNVSIVNFSAVCSE